MNIKNLFSEKDGVNSCNLVKLTFATIIVVLVTGCASSIPKKSSWVGTIGCDKKPVFLQFTGEDDYSGIVYSLVDERSSKGLRYRKVRSASSFGTRLDFRSRSLYKDRERYEFRLPLKNDYKTRTVYDEESEVLRIGDCEESQLVRMPENWGWGSGAFGEIESIHKRCSVARGWLDAELGRLGIKKPQSSSVYDRYRRSGSKNNKKIDDSLSPEVLAKVMISPGFERLFGKPYLDLTKEERKWLNYAVVTACAGSDTPLLSTKVQAILAYDIDPYSREVVLSLHNKRQAAINDFEKLIQSIEKADPQTVSKAVLTKFAAAQLPGKPDFTEKESSKYASEYREKLSSKLADYYIEKVKAIARRKVTIEDLNMVATWSKKDRNLWRKLVVDDEKRVKAAIDDLVSRKLGGLLEKDIQWLKQKVNRVGNAAGFGEPYQKLVSKYSALNNYSQYLNAQDIIVKLRGEFIKKWTPEVRAKIGKMLSRSDVNSYMRSIEISLDRRVPEIGLWYGIADNKRNSLLEKEQQERERIARQKREEEAKLFADVQKLILRSFKVPLEDVYDVR